MKMKKEISKEEILGYVRHIEATMDPKEKVLLLKELSEILDFANENLESMQNEIIEAVDKQKADEIIKNLSKGK